MFCFSPFALVFSQIRCTFLKLWSHFYTSYSHSFRVYFWSLFWFWFLSDLMFSFQLYIFSFHIIIVSKHFWTHHEIKLIIRIQLSTFNSSLIGKQCKIHVSIHLHYTTDIKSIMFPIMSHWYVFKRCDEDITLPWGFVNRVCCQCSECSYCTIWMYCGWPFHVKGEVMWQSLPW